MVTSLRVAPCKASLNLWQCYSAGQAAPLAHPLGAQQGKGGVKAAHVEHRHHRQGLPGWYST